MVDGTGAAAALLLGAVLALPSRALGQDEAPPPTAGDARRDPRDGTPTRDAEDRSADGGDAPPLRGPDAPPRPADEEPDGRDSAARVAIPTRGQSVAADHGHVWGGWRVAPFVTEVVTYDDNVFLSDGGEEDDVVLTTTVGLGLSRGGRTFEADVTASLSQEDYAENSGLGTTGGHVRARGRYDLGRGYVELVETLLRREDSRQAIEPVEGTSGVLIDQRRSTLLSNVALLTAAWDDGPSGVSGKLGHTLLDYDGRRERGDSREILASVTGRHEITPILSANLQLEQREVAYLRGADRGYSLRSVFVGCDWRPIPETLVSGRIGPTSQHLDGIARRRGTSAFSGTTGFVRLSHTITAKTSVAADFSRDVRTGTTSDSQAIDVIGAVVTWEPDPLWWLRGGVTYQRTRPSGGRALDSETSGARIEVAHRASDAVELGLSYSLLRTDSDGGRDYRNGRLALQLSILF